MKITFDCPACGAQEKISVLAVGWKKLHHRCPRCGVSSVHHYKQLAAAGLLLIGTLACWGVALTVRMAFDLSADTALILFVAFALIISILFMRKVIDACSSWRPQNEETARPSRGI